MAVLKLNLISRSPDILLITLTVKILIMLEVEKKKFQIQDWHVALFAFTLTVLGGLAARLTWTNTNTHDPGVTLLEAEDYSLSDLLYTSNTEPDPNGKS